MVTEEVVLRDDEVHMEPRGGNEETEMNVGACESAQQYANQNVCRDEARETKFYVVIGSLTNRDDDGIRGALVGGGRYGGTAHMLMVLDNYRRHW